MLRLSQIYLPLQTFFLSATNFSSTGSLWASYVGDAVESNSDTEPGQDADGID
jgi:hypothetical protein